LSERTWEFKSPRPHQIEPPQPFGNLPVSMGVRGCHDGRLLAKLCRFEEHRSK